MSQSYSAQRITSSKFLRISVTSKNCSYLVAIDDDEVSLLGPGVSERADIDEMQEFESVEDLAIYIVLLFENGLWPENED